MKGCSHCRGPGPFATWTTHPCALKRKETVLRLCLRCDLLLNGIVLMFAGLPRIKSTLRRYAKSIS